MSLLCPFLLVYSEPLCFIYFISFWATSCHPKNMNRESSFSPLFYSKDTSHMQFYLVFFTHVHVYDYSLPLMGFLSNLLLLKTLLQWISITQTIWYMQVYLQDTFTVAELLGQKLHMFIILITAVQLPYIDIELTFYFSTNYI